MRTHYRLSLALVTSLLLIVGAFSFADRFSAPSAQAQTPGAAVITLGTPTVTSGGTVSASGSVTTGLKLCSGSCSGGGGIGPICNCCGVPPLRECSGDATWRTCLITGVTYTITGPTPKSGSATIGNTSRTPSGCTTNCSSPSSAQCQDNSAFSLSTSGLAPGNYTLTVTSTDCQGQNSTSKTFPVENMHTLTVTKGGTGGGTVTSNPSGINCTAGCGNASASYSSGTNVTLTASPNQNNGSTFAGWSGACSNQTGPCQVSMTQARSVTATFNLPSGDPGLARINIHSNRNTTFTLSGSGSPQTGSLTASTTRTFDNVTAGTYTVAAATQAGCPHTISPGATQSVSGNGTISFNINYSCVPPSCLPNPSNVNVNQDTQITGSGGNNSYSWSGGGSPATAPSGQQPFITRYSSTGTKTVTVTSNGQTGTCNVVVGDALRCEATTPSIVYGAMANFAAYNGTGPYSWSAPGGTPGSGNLQSFSTTYSDSGTKTVTVTSGGQQASCSVTVGTFVSNPPQVFAWLRDTASGNFNLSSITIPYNTPVGIRWTSNHTVACYGPTDPNGTFYNPNAHRAGTVYPTNNQLKNFTFVIGCVGNAGMSAGVYLPVNVTPECLAAGQTASTSQTITKTARGGDGTNYSWSAPGGTPSAGTGTSFATSYSSSGTKTITVTSGGMSNSCTVTVAVAPASTGTIQIVSNVPTTWNLTGPQNQTQATPSTSATYTSMPTGNYVLGNVPNLPGFGNPTIDPGPAQGLNANGTTTFSINYPVIPAGVDLKANGSDSPAPIVIGSTALLTWTSSNVATGTCSAMSNPSGWSGSKPDSNATGENSPALNANTTFTLTCTSSIDGSNVSDNVLVRVREAACEDGVDNDGDSAVDGNDPGCGGGGDDDDEGNTWPQCNDNVDNVDAEDTLIDENDPGCLTNGVYDPTDNDEQNAGVVIGACNDGLDNDGDGTIDDADDGCDSDADPSELKEPDVREI